MTTQADLKITQGSTFTQVVRWEVEPYVTAAIESMTKASPVVITTQDAHGLVNGWNVAVVGARGMVELNAKFNPPRGRDFRRATVIDSDTVAFNGISSALFRTYTTGGFLQWLTPKDLTDYTARLTIKDYVGGTALLELTTENGGIAIDNAAKTITLTISAEDTEAIDWTSGVYDLEMISDTDEVTAILTGRVSVSQEITT